MIKLNWWYDDKNKYRRTSKKNGKSKFLVDKENNEPKN